MSPGGIAVDAQGQRLDHGGRTAGDPRQRQRRAGRGTPAHGDDHAAAPLRRRRRARARRRRRRRSRRTRTCSSSRARESSCCRSARPARPAATTARRRFNRPAGVDVDAAANEVYVADGFVNRRVVVFDATTGAYKRHWGGSRPGPVHEPSAASKVAKDGTVYVCDRGNNRVQVFDKDGKFLKQGVVSKDTRGTGSVWDIAFLERSAAAFLFVADGHDQKIFILRRDTLETVGSFGDGGRYPGHVLQRRQRRGRLERERLHGRDARGQTRAEVRAEGSRPVMTTKRNVLIGLSFAASADRARPSSSARLARAAAAQAKTAVMAPRFEVDPLWPKPLPNHWVLGQAIGVDRRRAGSRLDRAPRQPARRATKPPPARIRRPPRAA